MSYTNDLHTGFISDEVMLKLIRDIPQDSYEEKLELIEAEKDRVEGTFDANALAIRYPYERGFAYWQADQFEKAEEEFAEAQSLLPPNDHPALYMGILRFLSDVTRLLEKYDESQTWIDAAVAHLDVTESAFDRLAILEAYVLLINDTDEDFSEAYLPLIDSAKEELDFQIELSGEPIDDVLEMRDLHKLWNERFGRVLVDQNKVSKDGLIAKMLEYKLECPIGFYQNHAQDQIDKLNGMAS